MIRSSAVSKKISYKGLKHLRKKASGKSKRTNKTNWKHYRVILNQIGKGGFSRVYYGYDMIRKINVAIKKTSHIEHAKVEVAAMKTYGRAKYLPEFYDFFIMDNKAFIVMEYIEGMPLGNEFNNRGKKREEKLSVQITINILKGLSHLHNSGYIHRDIKPKNIMIKNDLPETVMVVDFNGVLKIKPGEVNSIQQDLHGAAKMCIYLMNGILEDNTICYAEIKNSLLKECLMRAFSTDINDRYNTAQDFIKALKPFA